MVCLNLGFVWSGIGSGLLLEFQFWLSLIVYTCISIYCKSGYLHKGEIYTLSSLKRRKIPPRIW